MYWVHLATVCTGQRSTLLSSSVTLHFIFFLWQGLSVNSKPIDQAGWLAINSLRCAWLYPTTTLTLALEMHATMPNSLWVVGLQTHAWTKALYQLNHFIFRKLSHCMQRWSGICFPNWWWTYDDVGIPNCMEFLWLYGDTQLDEGSMMMWENVARLPG